MTTPTTRLAGPSDASRWRRYVERHPDSTYCHRWAWREVFESTYKRRCLYLVAETGQDWQGVLPLVRMPGRLGGDSVVSLPYLDLGGPLVSSPEAGEHLASAAFDLVDDLGASRLDLRGYGLGVSEGPEKTERFRFVLDLRKDEEALWKAIGGKVRNQVRKSEKDGLETRRETPEALPVFYDVFCRNMRDLGSPVHSRRLFGETLARFGDDARLYLTRDAQGAPVAGGVAVRFRDGLVVPWASSLFSARPSCPNHSLYWRVLRDAVDEGLTHFDFGRSSTGSGTYRFKKQWGAEAVPLEWELYGRNRERIRDDVHLSSGRNARLASLWARLPLSVANSLGPRLRGRLPN